MTPSSEPRVDPELLETSLGPARVWWHEARGRARAVVVMGHGAGRGVDTHDLLALADGLPARSVTVALVDQPWVVAGRTVADAPRRLDEAFRRVVPGLHDRAGASLPLVVGGRSAGARVACRTAVECGAAGVLAVAFPLHPPGRPDRSRAAELLGAGVPALVLQGERDAFGGPDEVRRSVAGSVAVPRVDIIGLAAADHSLRVPARADVSQEQTLGAVVDAAASWVSGFFRRR